MLLKYTAREDKLRHALGRVSELAQSKIRETLLDTDQRIVSGAWSTFLPKGDGDESEACGCLMMDGYFKANPITFDQWYEHEHGGKRDWLSFLVPYYEMENWDEGRNRIREVADQFDNWVLYDTSDIGTLQWADRVDGHLILNQAGRDRLVRILDDIAAERETA